MKKHSKIMFLALLIYCFFIILLKADQTISSTVKKENISWLRRTFCKLNWQEIINSSESPKEICWRVRNQVKYKKEIKDIWSSGKETLNKEYGDCEDIATCIHELCRERGFNSVIYMFYSKALYKGHAVVIGKWKNKIWMSSNGSFNIIDSIYHAKNMIAENMGWKNKNTFFIDMPDNLADSQYKTTLYIKDLSPTQISKAKNHYSNWKNILSFINPLKK